MDHKQQHAASSGKGRSLQFPFNPAKNIRALSSADSEAKFKTLLIEFTPNLLQLKADADPRYKEAVSVFVSKGYLAGINASVLQHCFHAEVDDTLLHNIDGIYAKFAEELKKTFYYDEGHNKESTDDSNYSTPSIVENINVDDLPDLTKKLIQHSPSNFKTDIKLLAVICILSGLTTTVSFIHDGRRVFTNLFFVIIAPLGSGKNELVRMRNLFSRIVQYFNELFEQKLSTYNEDIRAYNNAIKEGISATEPKKPMKYKPFIPLDSSSASLKDNLHSNEGSGVAIDCEMDSYNGVSATDWGSDNTTVFRKGFENEPIEVERKGYSIDIPEPKFSVVMSGTQDQALKMFVGDNLYNGTFSRFILLWLIKHNIEFRPEVFDQDSFKEISAIDNEIADRLLEIYKNASAISIIFYWTATQRPILAQFFTDLTVIQTNLHGSNIAGSIFRNAAMVGKVAAVLGVIRRCDPKSPDFYTSNENELADGVSLECDDRDFRTALGIIRAVNEHAVALYDTLKNDTPAMEIKISNVRKKRLYDALPDSFKKQEAIAIGVPLDIPDRTVGQYLTEMTLGNPIKLLEREKNGEYIKIKFNTKNNNTTQN